MRSTTAPAALLDLGTSLDLLDRAVLLLEAVLAPLGHLPAGDALAARPTPCRRWDVEQVLAHVADAVDAFTEAATGAVTVHQVPVAAGTDVPRLRGAARGLVGAWRAGEPESGTGGTGGTGGRDEVVRVGTASLGAPVLVGAAALEIAVHADDLATALGRPGLDDDLAAQLWPVARALVRTGDRAGRFDAPREILPGASMRAALLAFLGRSLV